MTVRTPIVFGNEFPVGVAWTDGFLALASLPGPFVGLNFLVTPNTSLFRSMTLDMLPTGGGVGTGTLTIGLCTQNPNAFGFGGVLPSNQATVQVYSAVHDFNVGTPVHFTFDLEVPTLVQGAYRGAGSFESPLQYLHHTGFNGNLALVLTYTGLNTTFDAAAVTLTTDELPLLTGLATSRKRLSRPDFCPRCGTPLFREELIEDGYTKTLVCRGCWDLGEQYWPPIKAPSERNP